MNRKQQYQDRHSLEKRIVVKPAQDFVSNRMYYGVLWDRAWYLVSSDRVLRSFGQCGRAGIAVAPGLIRASRFSAAGLVAYLKGQTVSAAGVYQAVRHYIKDDGHVSAEYEQSLLALWTMGTYVHRVFESYPYLWLPGPDPSDRAARLVRALQPIVFAGVIPTRRELATLYRLTDSAATLLVDDPAGLHAKSSSALILAAGYRRRARLTRYDPHQNGFSLRAYSLYSPKILVGNPAAWAYFCGTSIPIGPDRQEPGDTLCPRRPETRTRQQQIVDDLHVFGLGYAAEIAQRYNNPELILGDEALENRTRDLWRPIFVLAHLVDQEMSSDQVTRAMAELAQRVADAINERNAKASDRAEPKSFRRYRA